jgi:soluble lytic murein transglycosylase-like protein
MGVSWLAAVLSAAGVAAPPPADAPLPARPAALAAQLQAADDALDAEAERWRAESFDERRPEPEPELWALRQQRILRMLARRPALSRRVERRLPADDRAHARSILVAMRSLARLHASDHRPVPDVRVGLPLSPPDLRRHYRDAHRRFGVGWHVLAAVNFVETAFGKLRNESTAGARGPMQFMPATWRAYGMGGDVRDPRDAIMGAANYLRASGAPRDYRRALYAYNPSSLYVEAVRRYARLLDRDGDAFAALWMWSVYWDGRRVSGPGTPSA